MKLWKRAVGVLKDKNSIYVAGISRRTSYRNPHLEIIVIKATSHDDSFVDYRNFHRAYQWARTSPLYIKPLIWSLSTRLDKSRSWIVAIKGLMLIHGLFCCKISAVRRIGRLPFDLSSFADAHSATPNRAWPFNAFVRAYFAYLDRRSTMFASAAASEKAEGPARLTEELRRLSTWQDLFELLLQVRPQAESAAKAALVFEAMICVVTEVFEVYGRIRRGIDRVVGRAIAARGKAEAGLALGILRKAEIQRDELLSFFEMCGELGVLNVSFCPKVDRFPEEDFLDLERIINGDDRFSEKSVVVIGESRDDDVLEEREYLNKKKNKDVMLMKTIITEEWEVFEEEKGVFINNDTNNKRMMSSIIDGHYVEEKGFGASSNLTLMPTNPPRAVACKQVLPDLITF